jgi:hypothetical protein
MTPPATGVTAVQTHVKVVAVLFMVFGALGLISAVFASLAFGAAATFAGASGDPDAPIGVAVLGLTGIALTVFLVAVSLPSIVCGWGLLSFRRWARILGIVLAAVSLVRIPFGTIFGAYALWVLFQKETERLFGSTVPAQG